MASESQRVVVDVVPAVGDVAAELADASLDRNRGGAARLRRAREVSGQALA